MPHRLHSMIGYAIRATDGDLGKVDEFYFDDATWIIRYMVVKTGNWLSGRKVLISLAVLGKPDWESRTFSVNLTCAQVRESPDIDTERPVYRQHEAELQEYYQWPLYWETGNGGAFGITPYPICENPVERIFPETKRQDDLHLRSTHQVTGYHIHATDGEIGHVESIIIDVEKWAVTFLVVDTGNWLPGKKVLISPQWIKKVNWADTSVYLDRSREAVQESPEFDDTKINRLVSEGNP
jgi:uncharacterized protein YrrD